MTPAAALVLAALALLAGAWRAWVRRHDTGPARLAEAIIPLLLVGVLFIYWESAALGTRWIWSACRLAPSLGLWHGYPLYSPADHGPINGWLYGPVAAILWTPAGLANSPRPALAIAMVINLAFLLAPLLIAGRRFGREPGQPGLLGFILGASALLLVYPTWYMASSLNADAIAVGLGAGSCLVLLGSATLGGQRLLLAAALGALAVWTKQVEAPLCLAQIGWLWLRHGRSIAAKYAAAFLGALLALAAVVGLVFGPRDVLFNMWTVPAAHALLGGWPAAWNEFADFCRYSAIFWVPGLLAFFLSRRTTQETSGRHDPLLLPALAAAVLLPTGIIAALKIGGDRNSIHSLYYLAFATALALPRLWAPAAGFFPAARQGLVLLAAVAAIFFAVRQVATYPARPELPARCLSEEAWAFAREHPGRVYYPWDPLATLMAGGRFHHFEYGVIDRTYAGRPPTAAHISGGLPEQLDLVVYPRADYPRTILKNHLPQYVLVRVTDDWFIHRAAATK